MYSMPVIKESSTGLDQGPERSKGPLANMKATNQDTWPSHLCTEWAEGVPGVGKRERISLVERFCMHSMHAWWTFKEHGSHSCSGQLLLLGKLSAFPIPQFYHL